MNKITVTAQMIVRNEDQFVVFAIRSVLPFVDKFLIYDTGSTDKTVEIIKSFNSTKIIFEEKGKTSPENLVALRNEQIKRTDTDFFLLVDGDEIWPKNNLGKMLGSLAEMPVEKIAAYCHTRNAVGDIYHYLPESSGGYRFQGKTGNFAMRAFRNVSGIKVDGVYPLETYTFNGKPLNDWDEKLQFVDTWYLHATHLKRSSSSDKVAGFRSQKIETGISFLPDEIPEIFVENQPKRSFLFEAVAAVLTPLKAIKRIYAKV